MIKISLNGEEITQNPLIPDMLACRSFYGQGKPLFLTLRYCFPRFAHILISRFFFQLDLCSSLTRASQWYYVNVLNFSKLLFIDCLDIGSFSGPIKAWNALGNDKRTKEEILCHAMLFHSKCFKLCVRLVLAPRVNLALQQAFFPTTLISCKEPNV